MKNRKIIGVLGKNGQEAVGIFMSNMPLDQAGIDALQKRVRGFSGATVGTVVFVVGRVDRTDAQYYKLVAEYGAASRADWQRFMAIARQLFEGDVTSTRQDTASFKAALELCGKIFD